MNAYGPSQVLGSATVSPRGGWFITRSRPEPVPCRVRAIQSDGQTTERDVGNAPADCAPKANIPPVAVANGPYSGTTGVAVNFMSAGSSDPDGTIDAYAWEFGDGGTSSVPNPSHTYTAAGSYTVTLTVTDNNGATASDTTAASVQDAQPVPDVSINSTSQDSTGPNTSVVAERPQLLNGDYSVVAINDLGMHCGDLDTRVASILPPFQVLLTQVIQKGAEPVLNPPGVTLSYSAAANPADPILGEAGVLNGLKADGSTYKTNFWNTVAQGAYDPFYPAAVTPLSTGLPGTTEPVTADIGLPVPNVENLYIGPDGIVNSGDEQLTAVQHATAGRDQSVPHQRAAVH